MALLSFSVGGVNILQSIILVLFGLERANISGIPLFGVRSKD
jgi:hypothetical protein